MSTTVSKILTYYHIPVVFNKKVNLLPPPPRMFSWEIYGFSRSSHLMCFMEKAVLKSFSMFTGRLQARNFIKNTLQHRYFPLNIAKFFRTPISKDICSVSSCFSIDSFSKFR